jgi:hypothetical protein
MTRLRSSLAALGFALLAACGGSDSTTPTPPAPVTSVTLNGATRVKVGDTYTYTVTARLSDGTIVQRPVNWGILVSGTATVTQAGVVVPLQRGNISLVATIDGVAWVTVLSGYDWVTFSNATATGAGLDADVAITNVLGTAEYPILVAGCVSGSFVVGVGFTGIVTSSGAVSYHGDNGTVISEIWLESPPDYHTLSYPGATNLSRRSFASTLAPNHQFTFAFVELQNGAHVTAWRLTGMSAAIAASLAACPSNLTMMVTPPAPADAARQLLDALRPSAASPQQAQRQAVRAATGPKGTGFPTVEPVLRAHEVTPMRPLHD